jgi:hypothetical protein
MPSLCLLASFGVLAGILGGLTVFRASAGGKSQHGKHVADIQRKIARRLHRGEAVPPGLAQALAALLAKDQRTRLGQLQNARRRGELRAGYLPSLEGA